MHRATPKIWRTYFVKRASRKEILQGDSCKSGAVGIGAFADIHQRHLTLPSSPTKTDQRLAIKSYQNVAVRDSLWDYRVVGTSVSYRSTAEVPASSLALPQGMAP